MKKAVSLEEVSYYEMFTIIFNFVISVCHL